MSGCCEPAASQTPTGTAKTHPRVGFSRSEVVVALAGNPNSGKSTIFTALTGARQHTGNWPGKTIEKKEGRFSAGGWEVVLIDLPGAYSLSAYSAEEVVAADYLLDGQPDVVVVVVDAGNLERNLYLAVQIVEMGLPVLIALNMVDMAEARGLHIDVGRLSRGLGGTPVVPTVARSGRGLGALKAQVAGLAARDAPGAPQEPARVGFKLVDYGREIEREIARLERVIADCTALGGRYPARWLAVKLLEGDDQVIARLATQPGDDAEGISTLLKAAEAGCERVSRVVGDECDIAITDRRYGFINGLVREVITRPPLDRRTRSDRIDQVITHPVLGLPIFAIVMWLVFQLTANVSAYYVDWIDGVISGPVARWVVALLGLVGLGGTWLEALLVNGVIAGVGGVLVFIPVLAFMYFFIAVLEDSGYMARAAFLMDRFMHLIGLHGKSFIPMLLGFGCSVPGVYATRTLDNERDRLLTGLLVPFMSCGARLPVYLVIGVAFFGAQAGTLVFALYVLGVAMAVLAGLLLKRTLFHLKEETPFVIELPPYRLPSFKGLLIHTWERTKGFVEHATTVILLATVIVWLLTAIPVGVSPGEQATFAAVPAEHSALAAVSRGLAPAFEPAGYGNWQSASSLVTGFIAKEVIVSTLSIVYTGQDGAAPSPGEPSPTFWQDLGAIGVSFVEATWDTLRAAVSLLPGLDLIGEEGDAPASTALIAALQAAFTPLSAVAFTVFVLLTAPCVTTLAALRHEFGTRWMAFSVVFMLTLAWVMSVLVYQGGLILGLE